MKKVTTHFNPEQLPSTNRKKCFTATIAMVLVLAFVATLTACSTNAETGISSSSTTVATPSTESTAEPTSTPETAPTKAFSDGVFQVSCVDFVPLYEKYLQESDTDNQNLVMKRIEDSDTVMFQMFKGEIDVGITMSFTLDGKPANEDEIMDSVSLLCARDSLNGKIWPSAFAALNQTIQPDLSILDCLNQLNSHFQDTIAISSDTQFSYEIGDVTYHFQMLTSTLYSITATTNPETLETESSSLTTEENKTASAADDVSDSPELVTDHEAFVSDYTLKLNILELLVENCELSATETTTETGSGLSHTFNGESTDVLLTFTKDGMILTTSSSGEINSQAALLAMTAITNTITPSVGGMEDCMTFVQDMVTELQETENITEEIVYRTVGNVRYGIACPGIIIFSIENV